jgi:hypothetical protein
MANSDIIHRMLRIIDDHESGRIKSSEGERDFESHMQALESIGLTEIRIARDLTYRLVTSWFDDGDEQFGSDDDVATIRADMRAFLRSLPGAMVDEQSDAPKSPVVREFES